MSGVRSNMGDWKRKADQDLALIARVRGDADLTDVVAFHAQQPAEKFLKAFLVHHGWKLKKIHDLSELLADARKFDDTLLTLAADCKLLGAYAVTIRYPSTVAVTVQQCEAAIAAADRIRAEILKRLPAHA